MRRSQQRQELLASDTGCGDEAGEDSAAKFPMAGHSETTPGLVLEDHVTSGHVVEIVADLRTARMKSSPEIIGRRLKPL
jgi:hypothetical protein